MCATRRPHSELARLARAGDASSARGRHSSSSLALSSATRCAVPWPGLMLTRPRAPRGQRARLAARLSRAKKLGARALLACSLSQLSLGRPSPSAAGPGFSRSLAPERVPPVWRQALRVGSGRSCAPARGLSLHSHCQQARSHAPRTPSPPPAETHMERASPRDISPSTSPPTIPVS